MSILKKRRHIPSWIFSVIFFLFGLCSLGQYIAAAFLFMGSGIILNPIVRDKLRLKTWVSVVLSLLLLFVGFAFVPSSGEEASNDVASSSSLEVEAESSFDDDSEVISDAQEENVSSVENEDYTPADSSNISEELQTEQKVTNDDEQSSVSVEAESVVEPELTLFEYDTEVNNLLVQYNAVAEYAVSPENVEKGNVRTKAIISLEGLYIEIVNSNRGFVTISIDDTDELKDVLYSVFRDFLTAINADFSEEDILIMWNDIQNDNYEIDYNNTGYINTYEVNGIQLEYVETNTYYHKISARIYYEITDNEE
ncbi:MAG: hypothetical protein LUC48_09760 [Clostridiales bacterium]|nr:hypothetical protein [Clostridiales bacterium]